MTSDTHEQAGIAEVAVIAAPGEAAADYFSAVVHGDGTPIAVPFDALTIPESAGALLAIGTSDFNGEVPAALELALANDVPVLGVGWGMHALNIALGGSAPVAVPEASSETTRMPVFISPGSKLSYTITGSGWVTVPFDNQQGITPKELAPGLMASCYREDRFLATIEATGRKWSIGVQWNAHRVDELPKNFDNLLLALVERAAGIQ